MEGNYYCQNLKKQLKYRRLIGATEENYANKHSFGVLVEI